MKKTFFAFFYGVALCATPLLTTPSNFSTTTQKALLSSATDEKTVLNEKLEIKKGWNVFLASKEGLDLKKTFSQNHSITIVAIFEPITKFWALYTDEKIPQKHLQLNFIEPHKTFFVLSEKDLELPIHSRTIDSICQKIIEDTELSLLYDTGNSKKKTLSLEQDISITSRYYNHEYNGIYDDSRVVLLYKKIPNAKKTTLLRYGPAVPKVLIEYAKAYENEFFYVYDYVEKSCYKGIFPSLEVPPFPLLQKIIK
ncbi:MAG: hypothetical protein U9N52_07905 [Campylobacterota bacterium]|nr:hypothetical protein [Campylobacterota bacterium]